MLNSRAVDAEPRSKSPGADVGRLAHFELATDGGAIELHCSGWMLKLFIPGPRCPTSPSNPGPQCRRLDSAGLVDSKTWMGGLLDSGEFQRTGAHCYLGILPWRHW